MKKIISLIAIFFTISLFLLAFFGIIKIPSFQEDKVVINLDSTQKAEEGRMKITSPNFENNAPIPPKFTCDGQNINPELVISDVPENAKSLALIVDDPDAPMGTFTHWVVFNIDPKTQRIKEGEVPRGANQGINDFGKVTYGGPCPPSGTHRYFFKIYALDSVLDLKEGATKKELEKEIKEKIIDSAQLVGTYKRGG